MIYMQVMNKSLLILTMIINLKGRILNSIIIRNRLDVFKLNFCKKLKIKERLKLSR
jgi:hypothetical protein